MERAVIFAIKDSIIIVIEVARRLEGTENARLSTGEIELRATDVTILNEAKTPPFYINEPDAPVDESLRLKYRYLDIRREPMQQRLQLPPSFIANKRVQLVHHNGFQARKQRIQSLRRRTDLQLLRRFSWGYAWDQFAALGRERGESKRKPAGGLPVEIRP